FECGSRAQRQRDLSRARHDFERGVARFPTFAHFRLALATLEAQIGNLDGAEKCLEAGISAAPNEHGLRLALIEARIHKGAIGKARAEIAALRDGGKTSETLELLEAQICLKENQWQEGARRL